MNFSTDYQTFLETHPRSTLPVYNGVFEYFLTGKSPKTIVILPGLYGIPDSLFKHITELEKNFTVLAINYPEAFKTIDELSSAIAHLLKFLELPNIYLYGHSYGSFVAQCVAKNHPDIVSGIILSNSEPIIKDTIPALEKKWMKYIYPGIITPKTTPPAIFKKSVIKNIMQYIPEKHDLDSTYLQEYLNMILSKVSAEKILSIKSIVLDYIKNYNYTKQDFSNLKSRVLILSARDDIICRPNTIDILSDLFMYPINNDIDGGHFSPLINPSQSTTLIRGFLNTMPLPNRKVYL